MILAMSVTRRVFSAFPAIPAPASPLVVAPERDPPFPADPGEAVHDAGAARFLALRVEDRVQGAEGPRIDKILDPLPDRHLAPLVDHFYEDSAVFDPRSLGVQGRHDLLDLRDVLLHPLPLGGTQRLAQVVHLFKIGAPIYSFLAS